ncbi:MAG: threonine synthase [Calditrichaceae bacterium]|nr:threonine synthase [Calditrichaceae bacterium]MBN2708896.1 threonine synthase [Calditrichaceae bacterium]RQV97579.1 MAG: threonine synthase [Calditrichota bacterium]
MKRQSNISHLQCVTCHREYEPDELEYTCPECGPLKGTLDVHYNYKKVKKVFSKEQIRDSHIYNHWRYLPLLPVENPSYIQPLQVGWTPLINHPRLNQALDLPGLYLKDDGGNVSASYKDRASSVAIVKALEKGYKAISAASSGNAAASISAFAASAGMPCHIFVPDTIPSAKLAQLRAYNADIILVKGTYDQAFEECMKESEKHGWYNRNTAINPYLCEGKKTGVLEICEQLNWQAPDVIIIPVGDGCILSGIWKGLIDLYKLEMIDRYPYLIGVQAAGSAPLVRAFNDNSEVISMENASTIADSICVGYPRDQVKALRAVHQSGGLFISVTDEQIAEARQMLAGKAGLFVEPAAAASLAGVMKLHDENKITSDQTVVVLLTGHGLKDIRAYV